MKEQDLRIGNLIFEHFIKHDSNGVPYIDFRETKVEWIVMLRQVKIPEIFTPIPITQKRADRIELNEGYKLIHIDGNRFTLEIRTLEIVHKTEFWTPIGVVEFMHELQNLYRFSYGEELTLTK